MPHCTRHSLYNPNCHDCREASLAHTRRQLDEDDDQSSAASILLTSALEDSTPTFDTTIPDTPADTSSDFDSFGGGDSGGGGASGDF
jgi:hypothetical protein